MRRRMRRSGWSAALGLLALLASGPALAMEQAVTTITFASNLWALNGDTVRQPMVPQLQKVDAPAIVVTDTLTVTPNRNAVTQVANFKADFGGGATITVNQTTMGNRILVANPTNRLDPFTGVLTVEIHNQAGTAMGTDPWTAQVAVDLTTHIVLDRIDAGGDFFIADIDIPGAVGDPRVGQPTFTGLVQLLSIPIEGTAFPDKFTTGMITVMKQIITKRRNNDPAATPTGFKTFTFTSTGSATSMMLTFVSPVVVDSFAGVGPNRVPIPIVGFARATNIGSTYVVPEPGLWLLGASGLGLAAFGRRRLRAS